VLVIGILLAIAIPTFLGARSKAQDSSAKSALRNAMGTANLAFGDKQDFNDAEFSDLQPLEGSLTWVVGTANSTDAKTISVGISAGTPSLNWYGTVLSKSGKCFASHMLNTGAIEYGRINVAGAVTCKAADATTAANLVTGAWSTTPDAGWS
jgi:type IV pilus assembly protein PilA